MKLFFLLLWLFFCTSTMAMAEVISSSFSAYGAGLHLLDAQMNVTQNKKTYEVITDTQTTGLLSVLLPSKNLFFTKGNIVKKQYIPTYFSTDTITDEKTKKRDINLSERPGFIDYQTGVLQMMSLKEPVTKTLEIADGRRDLMINFNYMGQVDLPRVKHSPYFGPADAYSVSIDVTAGRKKGWFFNRMKDKSSPPLRLYFARIGDGPKKAFVRGAFDTAIFGEITIYLTDFKQGAQ